MFEQPWYYYLSDSFLNGVFSIVLTDYKVLTLIVVGPVLWTINRYTAWTPWTSDDKIGKIIEEKLMLNRKDSVNSGVQQ